MKHDPGQFDSFLGKLKLEPVAPPPEPPVTPAHPRAVVMQMDRWQIAGNVVIIPDAGPDIVSQLLNSRQPTAQPASTVR